MYISNRDINPGCVGASRGAVRWYPRCRFSGYRQFFPFWHFHKLELFTSHPRTPGKLSELPEGLLFPILERFGKEFYIHVLPRVNQEYREIHVNFIEWT